jgi:hypothetical protein
MSLGPRPIVILFKVTDPIAHEGFDFSLGSHCDLESAPTSRPGMASAWREIIRRGDAHAGDALDLAEWSSESYRLPRHGSRSASPDWGKTVFVLTPQVLSRPLWSFSLPLAGWYTEKVPETAVLLEDIQKLASYHRRVNFCRKVHEQYAGDLISDKGGQPDWAATLESLRSLDRLEEITKVPPALQRVLSTEGNLDRDGLEVAATALAQEVASLYDTLQVAAKSYDLSEVHGQGSSKVQYAASELAAWAAAQAVAVDLHAKRLNRLCTLLVADQDFPVARLPAKLCTLVELTESRSQVVSGRLPVTSDNALGPGITYH